jgi:hypothetical protein
MLCRAYQTEESAHAAVDRLLAAGASQADVRILMGRPVHDHRDDAVGGFAGPGGERVGSFAGAPHSGRAGAGTFAGDADAQRVGGFGDIDRETVTSYHDGVPRIHIASHRDVKRMLVEAGLDEATADADVAALHQGRVLVLVRTGELTPEAAAEALDAVTAV